MSKKMDSRIDDDLMYDQNIVQSYTSQSLEDRILNWELQANFLNLVIENIDKTVANKGSKSKNNGEASSNVILDIGCGSGEVMDYVIQRVKPTLDHELIYHGIDVSPYMIDIAKKRYGTDSQKNNARRIFSEQDMHNMNIEDNSVDFIYSCFVFQHSKCIKDLLSHLSTKLKDGAKMTFLTNAVEAKSNLPNLLSGCIPYKYAPKRCPALVVQDYGFGVTDWCSTLEKSGFNCRVVQNVVDNNQIGDFICEYDIEIADVIIDATYKK